MELHYLEIGQVMVGDPHAWPRSFERARLRRLLVGGVPSTRIHVSTYPPEHAPESIEREHRWHAQELAEAFMERFPEDPIIFATENWRGDTDQVARSMKASAS